MNSKQKLLDLLVPVLRQTEVGKDVNTLEYVDDGYWGEDVYIYESEKTIHIDVTEMTEIQMIAKIVNYYREEDDNG